MGEENRPFRICQEKACGYPCTHARYKTTLQKGITVATTIQPQIGRRYATSLKGIITVVTTIQQAIGSRQKTLGRVH